MEIKIVKKLVEKINEMLEEWEKDLEQLNAPLLNKSNFMEWKTYWNTTEMWYEELVEEDAIDIFLHRCSNCKNPIAIGEFTVRNSTTNDILCRNCWDLKRKEIKRRENKWN